MHDVDVSEGSFQPGVRHLGLALRELQDRICATSAPNDIADAAALAIEKISATLDPYRYIAARDKGWGDTARGAGSRTLNPIFHNVVLSTESFQATLQFSTFHLGGNGAAHGGTIPMMFDEALGRLANFDRPICRTAYLNVDYRNVTPLDVELQISARFEKIDGRKRYIHATIHHGDVLTAEAHALFIELKEGAA
jgi:acyl-coenzyme A thioesterase PaaI-like protein